MEYMAVTVGSMDFCILQTVGEQVSRFFVCVDHTLCIEIVG